MPTTRKKVIKTVYKDENSDEEEGGDFSDSGSDAVISEASSSEDDVDSEPSSNEEFGDSFYKLKLKHPPKKSTKPLIRKRMKRKSSNSLMKDNLNASIFSVKDLTETDKLLPSTLNLSESDSSDEESPKTLDTSSSTKFQLPEQDNESVDEVNIEYKNVWCNINGVQDDSEEIAKKTFMELEQHKSQMEETKTTLQNYTLKLNKRESNVRDLLALGEETISTPEVSTVSKTSKLQKGKNDSDSDAEDWEEVNENKAIPQQSIQLLVEFSEAGRKKTKKIDIEMMMKRKINRVKKEYQIYMHKVHVLCWLGHGNFISRVLNNRILMAAALSLVPSKERRPQNKVGIKYIEEIITWYNSYITLKLDRNEDKFKSQSPPLKAVLLELIKKKVVTSKKYLVYLFVVLLRALGLQCRVMFNFVTLPIKPPATALCSLSTKSKDEEANSPQMEKLTMKKIKSEAIKTTTECRITKLPHKTKPKMKNIAQIDGNYDYYSDDELKKFDRSNESVFYNDYENIMQVDGADDSSTTRRIRRIKRPIADVATNIEFENRSPKRSRKDSIPISLELHTKGDEGKYSKVNKRAKGENNTVDKKEICEEKDHSNNVNNHFKELTNINSGKVREANATPNLPRKSPRHTVQRTHNKPSENKNLHENKRTQKNRRILHASDNSAAKKIKQENISKTKSRSTPEPHARYDDNEDVERPPRGEKLVNGKTIHGFEDKYKTCSNKLRETPVIPSESFKKDVSPPKQLRKSTRCLVLKSPAQGDGIQDTCAYKKSDRCFDSKENCDTNNHYKFSNNNSTVTTKRLTRGRINEVKKDINNTNSNIINRKALRTEQKNKSIVTKDKDNLNINEEITTRKIIKYNTRKKGNNPKSITTHIRLTRKQSQTMNTSDATEVQEKNRTRIFQGISTESCDKTQHIPKISVTEELSKIKQVGIRKNPTRNKKLGSVMDVEESENNMVAKSKLSAKKRISKGKIKEEFDNDLDYLPIEEKPRHSDSEDDFKPTTSKPKAKTNRRRLISLPTEDGAIKKNNTDVWCEIFDEELRQWICVDIMTGKVISTKEVYMNATHPVCYVVGWDNNNYLKDLTRKYVPHYNTETRKLRVDPLWWRKAILPYIGPQTLRDKEEDEYLDKMQLDAPLPTVIGEYKNHPLYVLKRHLLKFEALYPPEPTVLGFVRGEPVYARECVFTCRARHVWYKDHAKVVKLGEKPYKLVRARPRWDKINRKVINDDPPLEIFGPWQVEDFVPPMAENGIVPRNEYGNVELFKQCMLPRGTVHLKLPGLNKTAKKLNIDCATAITGFELVNGWVRPVYDGFVVCEEFEDIITEAWADDQEEQERKVQEKTELRIYGNWKRMIKGLLIRERLKNKYGFEEPIASGVGNGKSKGQRVFANNKKK